MCYHIIVMTVIDTQEVFMTKKIVLSLLREWVLSKRDDDVLPIGAVINHLKANFKEDVTVLNTSLISIEMTCEEQKVDKVKEGLLSFMSTQYGLKQDVDVWIEVSDYVEPTDEVLDSVDDSEKEDKEEPTEQADLDESGVFEETTEDESETVTETTEDDEDEEESSGESFLESLIKKSQAEEVEREATKKAKATKTFPDTEAINKAVADAKSFIGGGEYVKVVEEIEKVAPIIIKNGTIDTLTHKTYLFSINDGYGLKGYLSNLTNLLYAEGITEDSGEKGVNIEVLDPPKGESDDMFNSAIRTLNMSFSDKPNVICIDISEWMNDLESRQFKNFLIEVSTCLEKNIVVFRVPFVDKEVFSNILASLNDVVFVKGVSFPPFTMDEIREYATQMIEKAGFTIEPDAWGYFDKRITEEKSDGRFYGTDTIIKVVRELLYITQLEDATSGDITNVVTAVKAKKICMDTSDMGLTGYEMLDNMVGGDKIKARIEEIISQIELSRKNPELGSPSLHMRFVGNPGTGKTTVARIVGKILKERGVLRVGNFYECAGRDLCGRYIGETAPKTSSICRDAYGSVLFIDEAYSLYRGDDNGRDYGREALDTLIAEMENHRQDFVVIMAGYPDEMETLMQGNSGLKSRMPYLLEFPNFTRDDLYVVYKSMLDKSFSYDEDILPAVKEYFDSLTDEVITAKEFSNGRYVRNLFERTWAKAATRAQLEKSEVKITRDDFIRASSDKEFSKVIPKRKKLGFID